VCADDFQAPVVRRRHRSPASLPARWDGTSCARLR